MTVADVLRDYAATVADHSCFVNAQNTARVIVMVRPDATDDERKALSMALYRAKDFKYCDQDWNPANSNYRWVIVIKTKEAK